MACDLLVNVKLKCPFAIIGALTDSTCYLVAKQLRKLLE